MKTIFLRFILLGLLVSCTTSCFEIIEEVTVHNNGSGQIALTLNASQSKTKLASVMLLDSVQGHKVPSKADITKHVQDLVKQLKAAEGISNVTYKLDLENFIVTLGCDFKKVDNLNSFAQQLWDKQKVKGNFKSYDFDVGKMLFNRKFTFGKQAKEGFNDMANEDKKVLKDAALTIIYRFDNTIASFTNQQSKLSKSKKALMMKLSIMDIINGKTSVENNVQLTN